MVVFTPAIPSQPIGKKGCEDIGYQMTLQLTRPRVRACPLLRFEQPPLTLVGWDYHGARLSSLNKHHSTKYLHLRAYTKYVMTRPKLYSISVNQRTSAFGSPHIQEKYGTISFPVSPISSSLTRAWLINGTSGKMT